QYSQHACLHSVGGKSSLPAVELPAASLPSSCVSGSARSAVYALSLHDALPIWTWTATASTRYWSPGSAPANPPPGLWISLWIRVDRKSTRLNSSHVKISYAVFCLKKKNGNDRR